jgi:glycerophosphoryl diester phosphodiesterase
MHIIGHRGAKGLAPENSIEAIQLAMVHNVDMIEIDVRLQGDTVVLSHEETLPAQSYSSLSEVLRVINGQVALNIEFKEARVIAHLPALLKNYKGKVLFSSFKYSHLSTIKKLLPSCEVAVLETWSGVRAVAEAELLHTKRIHIKQGWLWGSFVRSLKHRGYEIYAYTVNSKKRAAELEEWGVDGVFTDYPDRFNNRP